MQVVFHICTQTLLANSKASVVMIIILMMLTRLILLLSISLASAASKNGASFSPVRELGPSLAASVAGGTVIAVRSSYDVDELAQTNDDAVVCKDDASLDSLMENHNNNNDDESIVLLFRSPIGSGDGGSSTKVARGLEAGKNLTVMSVFGSSVHDDNDNYNKYYQDGLAFLPNGPVGRPFLSNGNNNMCVLHANSGLVMAATGFANDAEHLLNVAAGRVLSRISVFDAPSSTSILSGKSVDPHRLVREDVSSMMIDAAMSDGGRPWGVQLLVIGQSALSRNQNQLLDMYTIDPSGGWRYRHGNIAAIGRGAENLHKNIKSSSTTTSKSTISGWKRSLDVAMNAAIHTFEMNEDDVSNDDDMLNIDPTERYSAVVIFANSNGGRRTSKCAAVCPDVITECYRRLAEGERGHAATC
jgi:20S proteasome alpha/beta subunit